MNISYGSTGGVIAPLNELNLSHVGRWGGGDGDEEFLAPPLHALRTLLTSLANLLRLASLTFTPQNYSLDPSLLRMLISTYLL